MVHSAECWLAESALDWRRDSRGHWKQNKSRKQQKQCEKQRQWLRTTLFFNTLLTCSNLSCSPSPSSPLLLRFETSLAVVWYFFLLLNNKIIRKHFDIFMLCCVSPVTNWQSVQGTTLWQLGLAPALPWPAEEDGWMNEWCNILIMENFCIHLWKILLNWIDCNFYWCKPVISQEINIYCSSSLNLWRH